MKINQSNREQQPQGLQRLVSATISCEDLSCSSLFALFFNLS